MRANSACRRIKSARRRTITVQGDRRSTRAAILLRASRTAFSNLHTSINRAAQTPAPLQRRAPRRHAGQGPTRASKGAQSSKRASIWRGSVWRGNSGNAGCATSRAANATSRDRALEAPPKRVTPRKVVSKAAADIEPSSGQKTVCKTRTRRKQCYTSSARRTLIRECNVPHLRDSATSELRT